MFQKQRTRIAVTSLAFLATAGCLTSTSIVTEPRRTYLQTFTSFSKFQREERNGAVELLSPRLEFGRWNELVLSWNAHCPSNGSIHFEARAFADGKPTRFYTLGNWSPDASRTSVRGQEDADGTVHTDTLVCRKPMDAVQVRITLRGSPLPEMKLLGVSLLDSTRPVPETRTNRNAWGKSLDIPERSQLDYAGGSGWCSPTAVSMILGYWGRELQRPDLEVPVPEVARAVSDPAWPGTGNWPFNTAFAGSFGGMHALVTRLDELAQVEDLIAAGVPVALSVSFDLLNGRERDLGNGHLIVAIGFTSSGDVVVNDPWPDPSGVNRVRKVFPRARVIRAWQRSKQTAYVIWPEARQIPLPH